jgi:hypothetical protein
VDFASSDGKRWLRNVKFCCQKSQLVRAIVAISGSQWVSRLGRAAGIGDLDGGCLQDVLVCKGPCFSGSSRRLRISRSCLLPAPTLPENSSFNECESSLRPPQESKAVGCEVYRYIKRSGCLARMQLSLPEAHAPPKRTRPAAPSLSLRLPAGCPRHLLTGCFRLLHTARLALLGGYLCS